MSTEEEKRIFFCRACMSECFDYKHLHKKGLICEEITTLAELLEFCTNLEIPENEENMPEQICSLCIKAMLKAVKFKKMVLENDKYLRKIALSYTGLGVGVDMQQPVQSEEEQEVSNTSQKEGPEDTRQEEESSESTSVRLEHSDVDKIHPGKLEFITTELEDGNEFVTLHYLSEDVIENDNLQVTETVNEGATIIQDHQDQYEIQYIDTETDNIDIVVDEGDELHEDIVEDYDVDSQMDQSSTGSDMLHFIKGESESADSFDMSVENDDSSQSMKQYEFVREFKARRRSMTNNEVIISDGIEMNIIHDSNKEKNPKFQCQICYKQLSNAGSFKYHMQLHSDKTPFLCSLCGEGFKTRNAYEGHLSTHDPNNPNTCDICGKRYRQPSSLRAHMVVHTGEKPFRCEICGKGLTQKSGYKKHLLTHTNEKPHECDICGRAFRYSSNFLAHRRTHDTKKIFRCFKCSKSFPNAETLEKHELLHPDCLALQCPSCPERFERIVDLDTHREVDHGIFDGKLPRSNIVEML